MASDDPFYVVKDTVATHLANAQQLHDRWKQLLNTTDTYSNPEFKKTNSSVLKEIKAAERPLNELKKAVEALARNLQQFHHISDAEIAQRRNFIESTEQALHEIKSSMQGPSATHKLKTDKDRALRADATMGATNAREMENTKFVGGQRANAQLMMDQQDRDLEALGQSVDTLGRMGNEINEELREQNIMLNKLDDDLDDAGERMNFVMAKLGKLLKTKDSCQIWSIIILTLILVILVFLVIYT